MKHGLALLVACCSSLLATGACAQAAQQPSEPDQLLVAPIAMSEPQACRAQVQARNEQWWPERDPSMRALSALAGHAATHGPGVAYPAAYGPAGVLPCVGQQDDLAKGIARYEPDSTRHPDE